MSRFTLSLIDVTTTQQFSDAYIAYGFDHILGPYFELIINEKTTEILAYRLKHSSDFDCHALAFQLIALTEARAIPNILRTRQHVHRLNLDLPI
jgi:hypothetical protein